jgi:hypothetical protein
MADNEELGRRQGGLTVVRGVSPSSGRSTAARDQWRSEIDGAGRAGGLDLEGRQASSAPSRRRPKPGPRPSRQAAASSRNRRAARQSSRRAAHLGAVGDEGPPVDLFSHF